MSKRIAELMFTHVPLATADYITAVPPDPIRKKKRGFDHTELIAWHLSSLLQIPYLPTLEKMSTTRSQASTTGRQERQKHLKKLFQLIPKAERRISKKNILLLDDVCTTGSTLRECKILLEKADARVFPTVFCMRI
ncbi:ComF family protein [Candidatus Woesebacteria bacterium]|nr:ComF family protein [Candidatus Woesebacteria bacterium]